MFESGNTTFHCFVDGVDVIVDTTKKSRALGFNREPLAVKLTVLVVERGPVNALCIVLSISTNENAMNGHEPRFCRMVRTHAGLGSAMGLRSVDQLNSNSAPT